MPFEQRGRTGEPMTLGEGGVWGVTADDERNDIPCRYCGHLEPFLMSLLERLGTWNHRARARGDREIKRNEVAVCADCRPRYEQDCLEMWAGKDREVASVCRSIRNGLTTRAPQWMQVTVWAMKEIRSARERYNRGDTGEDDLA